MSPRAEGGALIARRVRQAVDAAERLICGEGALECVAAVEGVALAGRRAARLHGADARIGQAGTLRAPWVDHRAERSSPSPALAFELTAVSGQQAVDHCLVAHRLAAYLGRPGCCSIDPSLAESVELLRLPDAQSIAELPPTRGATIADPRAAAAAAFDEVERATGRKLVREALRLIGQDESTPVDLSPPPARQLPAAAPIAIGGLAAGLPVEELLLDSVSLLEPEQAPLLDLGGAPSLPVVTVGGRHDDQCPLDLLLAMRSALPDGVAALERLRECGTLLVRARSEDPAALWAALHEDQRATIVRRRLRLAIVGPDADCREAVSGAIVAAVPELGGALGVDGGLVDRLPPAARSGAAALVSVDASRLAEPVSEGQFVDPVFPARVTEADPDRIAQLRQFHFAGIVPDGRAPDALLDEPLVPAVLASPELETANEASAIEGGLLARWQETVLVDRRRRRTACLTEVAALAERLRAALGLPTGPDPAVLAASLGAIGADFVDAGVLGERVGRPRAPRAQDEERDRRRRLALDMLESGLRLAREQPAAYIVSADAGEGTEALPSDVRRVPHPDGLRAAVGLFDGLAAEAVEMARGARIARLELAGEYDDALHGPMLARLDRASLTDDELFAIPAVAVLETARDLRGPALAAMSELIRAGRPVHVLVSESVSGLGARAGYHPGLGYLAVAHREALVVQSSLCRPDHLDDGLERARNSIDPVVIIAAVPAANPDVSPRQQLEAALYGRATPCFVYDPEGGANWADRFTLDDNPQRERAWPHFNLPILERNESFTFAHAAALDPVWRAHFLVIGPDSWSDEQVEIADYLQLSERERSRRLPFLWVVVDGHFARAVLRWELAFACRDRARAWHILQELAGTDNFYAQRAAEEARRAAQQEADARAERMESDFTVELEAAQGRGAESTVHRLVQLLADPAAYEAATSAPQEGAVPLPVAPPPPSAAAAAVGAAQEESPAAAAASLTPYIDSFLCTTCNDCTNINPRMFRYNADKQAEIVDPSAGTFEQLVKAAEKCPARCIHPGSPREGDKTATEKMIARAEKFQ